MDKRDIDNLYEIVAALKKDPQAFLELQVHSPNDDYEDLDMTLGADDIEELLL